MAASPGHLHKLMARNIKIIKLAWKKSSRAIQSRLSEALRSREGQIQYVPIRSSRTSLHPLAQLRQTKSRWYTTEARRNAHNSTQSSVKYDRSTLSASPVWSAINGLTGRAPFASTLRPNLTGGALNRTAGGYSLGSGRSSGARYFSHTPASPAQVVHNVSQAVRAFYLTGQRAQYDGVDPVTGNKRYRAVSSLQEQANRKINSVPKATPGSYVSFVVNPTITAITPLEQVEGFEYQAAHEESLTLNSDGLLNVLSADFSRALRDLAIVLNDLKKLSDLGNLPITYNAPNSLRVHFPGCDSNTVEKLCDEIGVSRGVVVQDADFDAFAGTEIALLFPFAPGKTMSENDAENLERFGFSIPQPVPMDWKHMMSTASSDDANHYSLQSELSLDILDPSEQGSFSDEHFDKVSISYGGISEGLTSQTQSSKASAPGVASSPLEYQDFEGLYRFLEVCDNARWR